MQDGSPMKGGKQMGTSIKCKPNIEVASDPESLAQKAVASFVADAQKAIQAKSTFHVAISGGHTPKRFFELLGEVPEAKTLRWDVVQLFWVDERMVDINSQWNNYKIAADTFLAKVAIPKKNIHRIPTEYSDFKMAACSYEETIRKIFGLKENQIPEFDLIILGMGTEGHIGSLFPNSVAPFDMVDLACVVYALDEKLNRVTLTHPVLSAAAHLMVLVSGQEKASILKEILTCEPDEVHYPVHILWPVLDKVTWLVDKEAAKSL